MILKRPSPPFWSDETTRRNITSWYVAFSGGRVEGGGRQPAQAERIFRSLSPQTQPGAHGVTPQAPGLFYSAGSSSFLVQTMFSSSSCRGPRRRGRSSSRPGRFCSWGRDYLPNGKPPGQHTTTRSTPGAMPAWGGAPVGKALHGGEFGLHVSRPGGPSQRP